MSTPERFLARTSICCLALLIAGEAPAPTEHGRLSRGEAAAGLTAARAAAINYRNGKVIHLHARAIGSHPDGMLAETSTPAPSWRARTATVHWVRAADRIDEANAEATFRF